MQFNNIEQVNAFLEAVKKCEGSIWLESIQGDKFNLKSELSTFIALERLLYNRGSDLELFCSLPSDESYLLEFFHRFPETI